MTPFRIRHSDTVAVIARMAKELHGSIPYTAPEILEHKIRDALWMAFWKGEERGKKGGTE